MLVCDKLEAIGRFKVGLSIGRPRIQLRRYGLWSIKMRKEEGTRLDLIDFLDSLA